MALERALIRPTADVRKFDPTADTLEVSDIDYVGAITLGTVNATGIDIGLIGILTTIKGDLQVDGTTTLVDTISAQGDVNLGDGGDTINIGFNATDTINLNTDLTVASGILLDLATNGGYLNLPTQVQAVAIDGTDGYLRLNIAGAADILEFLDIGVGWVTLAIVGGITLDDAYNASLGPSTITVDDGDVTWNGVGAYSFVVGLSGCTGVADGFFVEDGTDYFRLTHAAANTLNLGAALADAAIDAITLSLDSSDDSNFSISANDAGIITLTLECTNVGAGTAEIDINADDAIMIDSTGAGISLDCVTSANFTISANSAIAEILTIAATNAGVGTSNLDINIDDAITIDSANAGISLDGVTASNFTVTGADLTLSTVAAGDVNISSVAAVDVDGATFTGDFTGNVDFTHAAVANEAAALNMSTGGGEVLTRLGNMITSVASTVDATLQIGSRVFTGSGDVAVQVFSAADSGAADMEMAAQSTLGLGNIYIGRAAAAPAALTDNLYIAIVDAITIDSVSLSLDATTSSNFSITANDVNDYILTINSSNAGAGTAGIEIDATDAIAIESSDGKITIGGDDIDKAINLGTDGERVVSIGNSNLTSGVDIKSGNSGVYIQSTAGVLSFSTTAGDWDALITGTIDFGATASIELDAALTSNLGITANAVGNQTLSLFATNAGAGNGYVDIYSDNETKLRSTAGTVLIDSSGVLELNSSAGIISIGNDAIAQNINLGTAGARIVTIGNVTAGTGVVLNAAGGGIDLNCLTGAGTWDAATLSLDATDTSNITMTTNAAALKTLTIAVTNADALNYADIDIDADGTVYIDAVRYGVKIGTVVGDVTIGAAGVTTIVVTGSSLSYTSLNDIALQANGAVSPINVNDAVDTVLVGFASSSIVGALNELKEGYFAYGIHDVNAAAYAFNDFTVSALHVSYSATGACTITIDSDQIAVAGRLFLVKDTGMNAGANNVTIETEGAEKIDPGSVDDDRFIINVDGGWVWLQADGSNLWVVG